ncbi:unnamed protein product [Allacma fusca]|uniref:Uncharacterized protein n=1 Tax=Allacma fusca TaxID=39272 RepID=A0A8J2L7X1_9HEXA|nr:unnamed protein product [Allacma fusca]
MIGKTILTTLLFAGVVALSSAQNMKCRGMDMKVYEMDKMWMMECMKETQAKTPKEAMMMPCFRKCMVIKRGIVDDMGMPNKEKAIELVKMTAPDAVQSELIPMAESCVDMHGGKVKDWKMSCESYVPVCQCMADAFMNTCMKM